MPKPPKWDAWFARPYWSIADAAALLVGIEPMDPGPHYALDDQTQRVHDRFIAAAYDAVGTEPLTTWRRKYPGLPANKGPVSVELPPGDLMDFAIAAGFEPLAPIAAKLADLQRTRKLSVEETRRLQFSGLVAEIELRARREGVTIKIAGRLQFTRDEFAALLYRLYHDFPKSPSTLKSYIDSAGIEFRRGRKPSGAVNPLSRLFPSSKKPAGTGAGT